MSDYEIGKGRPPVETQFKKGNTEHLKRKRKQFDLSIAAMMQRVLMEETAVLENRRRKYLPRLQVQIRNLVNKAGQGDLSAAERLLDMHIHFKEIKDASPILLIFDEEDRNA